MNISHEEKMEDLAEEYDKSEEFQNDYRLWKDGGDATEEHYINSGAYELNLERYADKKYPPEDYPEDDI
jgi:hypothetical protein